MKKQDFLKEVAGLDKQALKERGRLLSEELMKLRFRKSSGQLDQTHRLREIRRNRARVNALLAKS